MPPSHRFPRKAKHPFMPFIHHHRPEVPSTNQWAMDWLKVEAPSRPVLFTADHQTAGKGQRDRHWHSERGQDVVMSLVLPVQAHWTPASLNKRVALSVRSALIKVLPNGQNDRSILVKWPNDVLVWHGESHYKVAGILIENVWRGSAWSHAVIGIGLNVQSRRLSQSYRAISLSDMGHSALSPLALAEQLAGQIVTDLQHGFEGLAATYQDVLFGLGEKRSFVVEGQSLVGMLTEVDDQGQGHFQWESTGSASALPASQLASSEVQWCWPN